MGTVVFSDAAYKIFLTAAAEERAKRRYKQLKGKGLTVTLSSLLHEIEARDERDATRKVAPLKAAAGALIIDTTGIPVADVVRAGTRSRALPLSFDQEPDFAARAGPGVTPERNDAGVFRIPRRWVGDPSADGSLFHHWNPT